MNTTASGRSLDLLSPLPVPQRSQHRSLWDDIKGIPGSMQLVNIPRLQNTWMYYYVVDGVKYLAAGAVVDAVRRVFVWLFQRIKLRYSTSAEFVMGDPAYEWITLFLTENNVWQQSRDFRVSSKSSKLVYGVAMSTNPDITGSADYVPTYESPQLFRWRGYWVEVQRYRAQIQGTNGQPQQTAAIFLTVFTRNITVLSELVEAAHRGYQDKIKPYVTIFLADSPSFGASFLWNVKRKPHRPLESIILPEGTLDDLIDDAKRFFASESWYQRAGIPHRRGYLLHGPPGTGKSSTIHAVAGILNLEIHSFSLASTFVDDGFLQRATTTIPKRSIVLVEDIDCALPSREDDDDSDPGTPVRNDRIPVRRSGVTLSGLLNMIDGIGSEEGKLFFATTNHIDRLDPALLRPGRIDRKIRYTLATGTQARGLYERLFKDGEAEAQVDVVDVEVKESGDLKKKDDNSDQTRGSANPGTNGEDLAKSDSFGLPGTRDVSPETEPGPSSRVSDVKGTPPTALGKISDSQLADLSQQFAAAVRDYEFSPAELQGYLLSNKERPVAAARDMSVWVAQQRAERQEKAELKEERKERRRAQRARMEAARFAQQPPYGMYSPFPPPPSGMGGPPPRLHPPPISPPPPVNDGDTDVVAVATATPPEASPTAAPVSPPVDPPPSMSALGLDPPAPLPSASKLVNGLNANPSHDDSERS
ncbi:P-loop containing nucleoside triphosphate hydrolase protein [Favolaschia claudopus]|uniref:P-loop containing nucleoside triphosphate hydrolase protein n=1 Tax=Favolaschia claudopus TaxID=2862362 RepID=A0AAW0BBP6_9AGAR